MQRCSRCLMPDTRPNSNFIDGICGACHNYDSDLITFLKEKKMIFQANIPVEERKGT